MWKAELFTEVAQKINKLVDEGHWMPERNTLWKGGKSMPENLENI